LGQPR